MRGWVLQIASALACIHAERVIHRDLKTANIFLAGLDGELAKLGDFGCSVRLRTGRNEPAKRNPASGPRPARARPASGPCPPKYRFLLPDSIFQNPR